MKLSKLIGGRNDGVNKITENSEFNHSNGSGGARFIHIYNPTGKLKTADTTITRALAETYTMKNKMTEESVIEYFDEMLQDFDDGDDDAKSIKSETMKFLPLKKERKFYFHKTNETSTTRTHEITYLPASKTKTKQTNKLPPSSSSNSFERNQGKSSAKSQPLAKNHAPSKSFNGTVQVTIERSFPINTTMSSIETSQVPKDVLQGQIQKEKISKKEMPKKNKNAKDDTPYSIYIVGASKGRGYNQDTKQNKNNKYNSGRTTAQTIVSSSSSLNSTRTSLKSGEQSIRSATSTHSNFSARSTPSGGKSGSGRDSVRSFEISIQSSGNYKISKTVIKDATASKSQKNVDNLERVIKKQTSNSIERKVEKETISRSEKKVQSQPQKTIIHSTDMKRRSKRDNPTQKEYTIEIYKSAVVPTTIK